MIRSRISEIRRRATRCAPRGLALTDRAKALAIAACLAAASTSGEAFAQQSSGAVPDPAAAALFQAGRELVEKGDWAAGCKKLEASLALYQSASTVLNIARCHEHDGKLASAWSAYTRALVLNRETPGEERRKALAAIAEKGVTSLEPRLPKLRIVMRVAPAGLRLTSDGQEVPLALLGTTIPVDPGEREIVAEAPGYHPERRRVTVTEGATERVEIALMPSAPAVHEDPERPVKERPHEASGPPVWALATGAGGLAMLGIAVAFRMDQLSVEGYQRGVCGGDVEAGCPASYTKPLADADNTRKNRDFGLFIGFGVGGFLGVGAAVAGILTAPPRGRSVSATRATAPLITARPWASPSGAGAALRGAF